MKGSSFEGKMFPDMKVADYIVDVQGVMNDLGDVVKYRLSYPEVGYAYDFEKELFERCFKVKIVDYVTEDTDMICIDASAYLPVADWSGLEYKFHELMQYEPVMRAIWGFGLKMKLRRNFHVMVFTTSLRCIYYGTKNYDISFPELYSIFKDAIAKGDKKTLSIIHDAFLTYPRICSDEDIERAKGYLAKGDTLNALLHFLLPKYKPNKTNKLIVVKDLILDKYIRGILKEVYTEAGLKVLLGQGKRYEEWLNDITVFVLSLVFGSVYNRLTLSELHNKVCNMSLESGEFKGFVPNTALVITKEIVSSVRENHGEKEFIRAAFSMAVKNLRLELYFLEKIKGLSVNGKFFT